MKFAFVPRQGFVAPQVLQIAANGEIIGRSFVQPDGSLGAFISEVTDEIGEIWDGQVFATAEDALDN